MSPRRLRLQRPRRAGGLAAIPLGGAADERGAATVLALAIVGAIVALAAGLVAVLGSSVASQDAANAADAAALAAADAVSGAVAGDPCALAGRLAVRNGARITACEVSGAMATISVVVQRGAFSASASARAGPPGEAGPIG